MSEQLLHIKNMVCPRCIMVVRDILEKNGVEVKEVKLGQARIVTPENFSTLSLKEDLLSVGFELLQDPEEQLTEGIRLKIHEYLRLSEEDKLHSNLSAFLTETLHKNYTALSKHFAFHFGQTIENYYIHCRIERVKELLQDKQMNVSQIADKLGYSSVHYLSGQFKKVTGNSISEYKQMFKSNRTPLDLL